MPDNKHIKIKALKSIATIWIAVLFLSCQNNNIETIQAFSHPPGSPDIVAENIEILHSDSAIIRFKLTAPLFKVFQDEDEPYTEFPDGFNIEQYTKEKAISSSLTANYGKFYDKKSLWEARHNVVAVTETNDTLLTDVLFWDEKKEIIYSDQFVKIIQEGRIITGVGFESDLQMTDWFIKNVQAEIEIEINDKE